ncbi:MAG: OmpA family protein [Amaricoccus sp.]
MDRKWIYIGGGATLLAAGVAATLVERGEAPATTPAPAVAVSAEPAAPPAATAAVAQTAVAPAPAEAAQSPESTAAEAAIARLTAALAEQEAENARLRTTIEVRDAVLTSLRATIAERDAALDDMRDQLAAGDRRIATLQASVDAARSDPGSFEAAIAALKPEGVPSAARIEVARTDSNLDAVFAAKEELSAPAPLLVPAARSHDGNPSVDVHFDFASAALTPGGVANTNAAAVSLRAMTLERIRIVGHTDTVGSPVANRRLAARRAGTVAAALIAAGVSADLIEIDDMGETDPPVATSDGVPEPMNRSVAIIAIQRTTS